MNYLINGKIYIRWSRKKNSIYIVGTKKYLADMETLMKEHFWIRYFEKGNFSVSRWVLRKKCRIDRFERGMESIRKLGFKIEMLETIGKGVLWW